MAHYDVSFLSASMQHGSKISRAVFGAMSGGKLSAKYSVWSKLTDAERDVYLKETHELAHHSLFVSTPIGVLNWRIEQVLSRDIGWVLHKLDTMGIDVPESVTPCNYLFSENFYSEITDKSKYSDSSVILFILETIQMIDDLYRFRRIVFGRLSSEDLSMSVRDMIDLMNSVYSWLHDRCDANFVRHWHSNLPLDTPLFDHAAPFNAQNIAEAHAVSAELFRLRAIGDLDLFDRRLEDLRLGVHRTVLAQCDGYPSDGDGAQFSPYFVQQMCLLSFCGPVDVRAGERESALIEEALPWFRLPFVRDLSSDAVLSSMRNLFELSNNPLIGPGSQWMQFRSTPKTTDLDEVEGILDQIDPGEFLLSVTSMGIDLQILQIHRGISANYRFLSGIMSDAIREQDPAFEYKGIDFDEWNCEMIGTVPIIEYSDILLLNAVDMDEHYSDHVIAETGWFEFFRGPVRQAFAIFLAGSSSRYNAAAYFGHFLPDYGAFVERLAATFGLQKVTMLDGLVQLLYREANVGGIKREWVTFV